MGPVLPSSPILSRFPSLRFKKLGIISISRQISSFYISNSHNRPKTPMTVAYARLKTSFSPFI
jgi:hypothetical protein